jgi:hypothetical protein
MNAEQKKERVRQYYEEVWCQGKLTIVDELFAPGYENCDPATPGETVKGREAFKSLAASYREAFPDLRLDVTDRGRPRDVPRSTRLWPCFRRNSRRPAAI